MNNRITLIGILAIIAAISAITSAVLTMYTAQLPLLGVTAIMTLAFILYTVQYNVLKKEEEDIRAWHFSNEERKRREELNETDNGEDYEFPNTDTIYSPRPPYPSRNKRAIE